MLRSNSQPRLRLAASPVAGSAAPPHSSVFVVGNTSTVDGMNPYVGLTTADFEVYGRFHPRCPELASGAARAAGVAARCTGESLPVLPSAGDGPDLVSCHLAAVRLAASMAPGADSTVAGPG